MHKPKFQQGFSVAEMLVVIAVSGILIVAITMFVGRSFQLKREQFEQVQITEDARIQLQRIGDTVKNGRYVDCNENGVVESYGPPPERWVLGANKYAISFRTNVDDDDDPERVSYYLNSDGQLMRQVAQLSSTGCEETSEETASILKDVRNRESKQALFEYFKQGGADPIEINNGLSDLTYDQLSEVQLVRINLVVDANVDQNPTAALVTTSAQPRMITNNMCESETSVSQINVEIGVGTNYVLDAFTQCQDFCGGSLDSSIEDACCAWHSFIIGTNTEETELQTICSCAANDVSDSATSVDDDNFTTFVTTCLNNGGTPSCNAGCLQDVGGTGACECNY